ncbi:hypothetical protein [Armatimonas sp.]|uniref:hypothetical protein n=1 Tax=Armatimonas sp. TaxID=1872638 RepID=UPI00375158A8
MTVIGGHIRQERLDELNKESRQQLLEEPIVIYGLVLLYALILPYELGGFHLAYCIALALQVRIKSTA